MNKILRNSIVGFVSLLFFSSFSQEYKAQDLYGQWQIIGSFRKGEQVLEALKDTIKNPTQYYFTFNKDGTFTYDVISLEKEPQGEIRNGTWHLSPNGKRLTLIDSAIDQEKRIIPGDFINFATDGTLSTKPMIFPILELSENKLVLYDEYHKTLDIFRK
ncbi:DUF5004 domain-containing protein [uncultured Muriicola sp.]|uniref:lipocalin family protein n=1 Tax=uncultured Muriicola sp. TaxID=1583102 RepID=UPI0026393833|nr:DUF5004 domain-containing protein [uncultured Muriicola sp.]